MSSFARVSEIAVPDLIDTVTVKQVPLYDSSNVQLKSPSAEKEEKLFSDPRLRYDHKVVSRESFMERFLDWVAELLFGKASSDTVSSARSILIWTFVIVALVIVGLLFFRSDVVGLTRSRSKSTVFNFTDVTEDLSSINFDTEITKATNDNNYRLAIRWHYLKLLYMLDVKQLMVFAPYKTNIDYSNELKGKAVYAEFIRLSRVYDYIWYGKFKITSENYNEYAQEFKTFEKQVNV